jgi:Concanavalin A-like lectin/glucanases superfamily
MQSPTASWLVFLYPRDSSGAEVELRISSHGFTSIATDTIGVKPFPAWLVGPPLVDISIFSPGTLGGVATVGGGQILVRNPRTDKGRGPIDSWRDLYWSGARFVAYWAESARRTPKSFAEFTVAARGLIEKLIPDLEAQVYRLSTRDARLSLDRELDVPTYRGAGPRCVRTTAAASASAGDVCDASGSFTVGFLVKPRNITTTNQRFLSKYSGLGGGYEIGLSWSAGNEGRLRFRVQGLSPEALTIGAANALVVGTEFYRVVAVLDNTAKTRQIYVDGRLINSDTFTGSPTANAQALALYTGAEADVVDFFFASAAWTEEDVANLGRGPLAADEAPSVVAYWPVTEGAGTTLTDTKGGFNATMTSGSWVPSLEGSADLVGIRKPVMLGGRCWNAEPVVVSAIDRVVQWHYRASRALPTVRSRGAVLVEGAGGGTNYTKDLATSTASIHTLPGDPGVFTLNADGDDGGKAGYVPTTLPTIIRFLVTQLGPLVDADLESAPFGIGTASTYPNQSTMEVYLREGGTLAEIIEELAASQGAAVFFNAAGKLDLVRLDSPTGTADVVLSWQRHFGTPRHLDIFNPTLSQRVTWQRNYRVMTDQELVALDTALGTTAAEGAAFRAFSKLPYRLAEAEATKPDAERFREALRGEIVEAGFTRYRDAWAEAKRRQRGWHGRANIEHIALPLTRVIPGLELGAVAEVTAPGINGGAAKKFVVVGLNFQVQPFGEAILYG